MTAWLLLGLVALPAQNGTGVEPIADNSFLIEEAYNQEPNVVQHISVFTRQARTGDWAYSFTQEWPVNRFPKNQFSYGLTATSGDPGGLGDSWINWRYQWKNSGAGSPSRLAPVVIFPQAVPGPAAAKVGWASTSTCRSA